MGDDEYSRKISHISTDSDQSLPMFESTERMLDAARVATMGEIAFDTGDAPGRPVSDKPCVAETTRMYLLPEVSSSINPYSSARMALRLDQHPSSSTLPSSATSSSAALSD